MKDYNRLQKFTNFLSITFYSRTDIKDLLLLFMSNFLFLTFENLLLAWMTPQVNYLRKNKNSGLLLFRRTFLAQTEVFIGKDIKENFLSKPVCDFWEQPIRKKTRNDWRTKKGKDIDFQGLELATDLKKYLTNYKEICLLLQDWKERKIHDDQTDTNNQFFKKVKLEGILENVFKSDKSRPAGKRSNNLVMDCVYVLKFLSNFRFKQGSVYNKLFDGYLYSYYAISIIG